MMAALFGRKDIVELLLRNGSDPAIHDYRVNTSASLAEVQGLRKIVQILRFHWAD